LGAAQPRNCAKILARFEFGVSVLIKTAYNSPRNARASTACFTFSARRRAAATARSMASACANRLSILATMRHIFR